MDELVDPLNEVMADDTEFACLRAFVFFDPCEYLPIYNFLSTFFSEISFIHIKPGVYFT